jgi:hypothetical protein
VVNAQEATIYTCHSEDKQMGFNITLEDVKTSKTKNGQPSYHFHKMDQTAQLRLGVTPIRSINRWGSESISFSFRGNQHSTVLAHNEDRLAWKGQLMVNEQWYDDITLISELKTFPNGSQKNVIVTLWKDGQIEDKPTVSCCDDLIKAAMEGHPLDPKIVTTELHQAFCKFSEEVKGERFLPMIWLIEQQRVLSKENKTLRQANSTLLEEMARITVLSDRANLPDSSSKKKGSPGLSDMPYLVKGAGIAFRGRKNQAAIWVELLEDEDFDGFTTRKIWNNWPEGQAERLEYAESLIGSYIRYDTWGSFSGDWFWNLHLHKIPG